VDPEDIPVGRSRSRQSPVLIREEPHRCRVVLRRERQTVCRRSGDSCNAAHGVVVDAKDQTAQRGKQRDVPLGAIRCCKTKPVEGSGVGRQREVDGISRDTRVGQDAGEAPGLFKPRIAHRHAVRAHHGTQHRSRLVARLGLLGAVDHQVFETAAEALPFGDVTFQAAAQRIDPVAGDHGNGGYRWRHLANSGSAEAPLPKIRLRHQQTAACESFELIPDSSLHC